MHISRIQLKNFRGYYSLKLDFFKGINVFIGKNASGKTNLLEALYYLSFAKSFRGVEDKELIKNNESKAVINAEVLENTKKNKIDVLINEKGKKLLINDKGVSKLSSLNKIVNVIVFEPQDVNIFRDLPKVRRNFLDINISKLYPLYNDSLIKTENLLKERNEILKQDVIDFNQLDVVTSQLINEQKEIIIMRQKFVDDLNIVVNKIAKSLMNGNTKIRINYFPYLKISKDYKNIANKLYKDNLDNDIKRKTTNIGIHREDFILNYNGMNISINGSQGENRLMAICLKLSPYFLVEKDCKHPIIALDDVLSELDNDHQNKLLEFLFKLEQVFITTTSISIKNANIYEIDNHHAIRRTK